MSRKEKRALAFGHSSPNRHLYQKQEQPTCGLDGEMVLAYAEFYCSLPLTWGSPDPEHQALIEGVWAQQLPTLVNDAYAQRVIYSSLRQWCKQSVRYYADVLSHEMSLMREDYRNYCQDNPDAIRCLGNPSSVSWRTLISIMETIGLFDGNYYPDLKDAVYDYSCRIA